MDATEGVLIVEHVLWQLAHHKQLKAKTSLACFRTVVQYDAVDELGEQANSIRKSTATNLQSIHDITEKSVQGNDLLNAQTKQMQEMIESMNDLFTRMSGVQQASDQIKQIVEISRGNPYFIAKITGIANPPNSGWHHANIHLFNRHEPHIIMRDVGMGARL